MKRVLFLGNSFTYYNDLPAVFAQLCKKMGMDVSVSSITKGGASLREFLNEENQIAIQLQQALSESWDVVVLQEQSFRPIGNSEAFLTAAEEIGSKFPVSQLFFYQTWAYRDCSQKLQEKELSYAEMHEGLKRSYYEAATRCGGTVVPVGDLFCRIWMQGSPLDLYRQDDFHPSLMGTYLAACSFVAEVFNINPHDLPDIEGIPTESASLLREVAAQGKLS